jgi:hypothetical protein
MSTTPFHLLSDQGHEVADPDGAWAELSVDDAEVLRELAERPSGRRG